MLQRQIRKSKYYFSNGLKRQLKQISQYPVTVVEAPSEIGRLEKKLAGFDDLKSIYRKFSKGKAAGLNHLMRAEVMLERGKDEEAEILCYKAMYKARAYRQTDICIYVEVCLARIFMIRGDVKRFLITVDNIKRYKTESADLSIQRMVDVSLSIVGVILGEKEYIASWLYNLDEIKRSVYKPVIPFIEILYFGLLMQEGKYNELIAMASVALEEIEEAN